MEYSNINLSKTTTQSKKGFTKNQSIPIVTEEYLATKYFLQLELMLASQNNFLKQK